ncbi:MAG: hypothetical protein K5695_04100 [Oscillospiraceae bacterium]|nr:hypothetical protein [Oscillospiraceae bacterium]
MRTASDYVKMALAILLVLTCASLCVLRLMKVQVVNSAAYHKTEVVTSSYTQKIAPTRGEIVDAAGLTIVSNHVSYAVVIDEKNFPSDNIAGNAVLLRLTEILTDAGVEWEDTLYISKRTPYSFSSDVEDSRLRSMKKKIGVNAYATAQNCMDVLCEKYEISDKFTPAQKRTIVGIRYTMLDDDFSISNRFQLAHNLPMDTVTKLSELAPQLQGVLIEQTAARRIEVGDVLPHEIGTTGPIYAENAAEYLEKGYDLDAIVGISGLEKAMEDELQGKAGVRTITYENGVAVSDEITEPVDAGHTIRLTVNAEFQRGLQDILENFLANHYTISRSYAMRYNAAASGALVVLDAKTGAILGEVTAPTFDLTEYSENYEELTKTPGKPLFNRATMGLYRPGSTFKTITATAGLNEGIVEGSTSFLCTGTYNFHGFPYHCTGHHNYIAVAPALRVSCNSYFYELSRLLTIDNIVKYADLYGIGQHTGIETADAAGWMATPETYQEQGLEWTSGQVLQAGIGNGDTMVTPLQLAVVANTIANEGKRLRPYLVDSIWDYNQTTCLQKTEPEVVSEIDVTSSSVYKFVEAGMIQASGNGFPKKYSLQNLGYSVAIKTGTPQVASRVQDSVFIGYAPADDPQIAFAGLVEGGEYSKYMIRDILLLYEEVYGDM